MPRSIPFFLAAFEVLTLEATPGQCLPDTCITNIPLEIFSGAEDGVPPAGEPALHPVAPDPFGTSTEIRISFIESSVATITVFDVECRRVWWRRGTPHFRSWRLTKCTVLSSRL